MPVDDSMTTNRSQELRLLGLSPWWRQSARVVGQGGTSFLGPREGLESLG